MDHSAHPSPADLRRLAVDAAIAVGAPLRRVFRSQMDITTKSSAHDLVTVHDSATEDALVRMLSEAVPDSRITGEEGGSRGGGRVEWIIDPIDGTSNFAHGFAMFSVSIAAAVDHTVVAGVVHDPVNRLTFSADQHAAYLDQGAGDQVLTSPGTHRPENQLNLVTSFPSAEVLAREGEDALAQFGELVTTYSTVRRVISGALELCHVAAGWADIAAGTSTKPWDVAAGQLVLRRAGGRYLPFGSRHARSWDGDDATEDRHLAPGYVGLGAAVEAPTAVAAFRRFATHTSGLE